MSKHKRYSYGTNAERAYTDLSDDALSAAEHAESVCLRAYNRIGPLTLSLAMGWPLPLEDAAYLERQLPDQLEAAAKLLRKGGFIYKSKARA